MTIIKQGGKNVPLCQIFWPEDCSPGSPIPSSSSSSSYYLVGWNINGFKFCIAAFVPCDIGFTKADAELQRLRREGSNLVTEDKAVVTDIMILGKYLLPWSPGSVKQENGGLGQQQAQSAPRSDDTDEAIRENATIWLKVTGNGCSGGKYRRGELHLNSLQCCGSLYHTRVTFVFYSRSHRYLSSLAKADSLLTDLDCILIHIRSARLVGNMVNQWVDDLKEGRRRPQQWQQPHPVGHYFVKVLCCINSSLCLACRTVASIITMILPPSEWLHYFQGPNIPPTLTCPHIVNRFQKCLSLPCSWRTGDIRRSIQLEGFLVNVIADTVLGIVCGTLVFMWADSILVNLASLGDYFCYADGLRGQVDWLNHYPGGFKLNVPLTKRLGAIVIMVLELHDGIVHQLQTLLSHAVQLFIIRVFALLGFLGATTLLACLLDILRLVSLHITIVFAVFARLYYLELSMLLSLWQLFQGKKRNILRHRIDTCIYDTQQLLLGTLVFTVFSALFPTIAIFYIFFLFIQALVIGLQGAAWLSYVLLRDFPLYQIFLFLVDPGRLPGGGIRCRLVDVARKNGEVPHHGAAKDEYEADLLASGQEDGIKEQHHGSMSHNPIVAAGQKDPWHRAPPSASFVRLEVSNVPFSSLFQDYANIHRVFKEECPGFAAIFKLVLTGTLVSNDEENGGVKLWFLHYRNGFSHILTKIAVMSDQWWWKCE